MATTINDLNPDWPPEMCLPGVLNNTLRNTKEAIKTTIGASHNITTGAQVVGVVDSNTGEPAGEDYYNASQDLVIHQSRDPTDTSKEATYRQIAIVDPAANVMKPLYIGSDNGTDLSQASLDLEYNGRNVDGDDFAFRYKNEGLWIVNDGYNHISWKVGRRYQDLLSQADATSSAAGSSRWRRKKFHHNHRFHVIASNSSSIDGMMAVRMYAFKAAPGQLLRRFLCLRGVGSSWELLSIPWILAIHRLKSKSEYQRTIFRFTGASSACESLLGFIPFPEKMGKCAPGR